MSDAPLRVQFIHGLESSPAGPKAVYLRARFTAHVPAMETKQVDVPTFRRCVEQQLQELQFLPDVLVGSSFGGAVAVELLRLGVWRGPTLLLAQAALLARRRAPELGPEDEVALPAGVRVTLVHGLGDDVVPPEDSRRLARTGTPGLVRLVEVDDGHRLEGLLDDEALADLVREVARPG